MTINEQIAAIRRELEYRRKLYPRWVEIKKINQKEPIIRLKLWSRFYARL